MRDWLNRASHDLRSSRALASLEDPLLDTAIYHCQQAAEKSVKAWLQSIDDPFPKTHDVEAGSSGLRASIPSLGNLQKPPPC